MSARRLDRRQFLFATGTAGLVVAAGCSSSGGSRSASTTPATIGPTDPAVAAAEAARPTTGTVVRRELRAAPVTLDLGRERVETWNTTTMWHPIHLRGHTFHVGADASGPRNDVVNVP